jgi:hypothetical protein
MAEPLDREATIKEFGEVVNMTPAALDTWLAGEESKAVGWHHDGEEEAVGHQSGRRIVEVKRKKKADLTDDDLHFMRRVIGYVHRHLAQGGPADDKQHSRWRYSLMNWGHDPLA